ncbi:hypothetical protein PanWU01x14_009310 [Parasponia andersonii]|uniref:Transmembrane protein n=1 Tax=Parasponia andersonii TaxID=3476 RepID=A0A2P5E2C6_PARAD|nr:hypothetical protein PanWU01x14_009310 [Parasponia andersonii]
MERFCFHHGQKLRALIRRTGSLRKIFKRRIRILYHSFSMFLMGTLPVLLVSIGLLLMLAA